jgi:hypothetical protein
LANIVMDTGRGRAEVEEILDRTGHYAMLVAMDLENGQQ